MNEAEWLACTDPKPMLELLYFKVRVRKLRLFACACCRRVWSLLHDERSQRVVEVAERYAGSFVPEVERSRAREEAFYVEKHILLEGGANSAAEMAASAAGYAGAGDEDFYRSPEGDEFTASWGAAYCAAESVVYDVHRVPRRADWTRLQAQARRVEQAAQASILRDIIGNPFRPIHFDLASRLPAVLTLATAAYEDRILPACTLDPERLAVLADALEESGCTDADILGHLRGSGPHVRGCHVLDLLLEKT